MNVCRSLFVKNTQKRIEKTLKLLTAEASRYIFETGRRYNKRMYLSFGTKVQNK